MLQASMIRDKYTTPRTVGARLKKVQEVLDPGL